MFYISSRGSTANHWLAKVLSKHPQVVCFRSTRSFPPFEPGSESSLEMSVERFLDGLLECSRATFDEKVFGSIHGYHGITAKQACEQRGGIFSYLIRHPISRIHSAFIHHLINDLYRPAGVEMSTDDAHARVCSLLTGSMNLQRNLKTLSGKTRIQRLNVYIYIVCQRIVERLLPLQSASILSRIKRIQRKIDSAAVSPSQSIRYVFGMSQHNSSKEKDLLINESHRASRLFVTLCKEFMSDDSAIYTECSTNAAIVMEEMVTSQEYFRQCLWSRVAPQIDITDSYLVSVFSEPRINIHRQNPMSPKEIWQSWPDEMKAVFQDYFERYNLFPITDAFGYDISFM